MFISNYCLSVILNDEELRFTITDLYLVYVYRTILLILSEGWYGTVYCLINPQIFNSRMCTHLLHTSHFSSRILISSENYFDISQRHSFFQKVWFPKSYFDISQRHSFLQKVWFGLISSKNNFVICVWERDEISQPLSYEPQHQQHLLYTFPMNLMSPLAVCDVGKV